MPEVSIELYGGPECGERYTVTDDQDELLLPKAGGKVQDLVQTPEGEMVPAGDPFYIPAVYRRNPEKTWRFDYCPKVDV